MHCSIMLLRLLLLALLPFPAYVHSGPGWTPRSPEMIQLPLSYCLSLALWMHPPTAHKSSVVVASAMSVYPTPTPTPHPRKHPLFPSAHFFRYRGGVHMKRYPELRHADRGAVSISLSGNEFLIALTRCLHRDDTHQVGRQRPLGVPREHCPCPPRVAARLLCGCCLWRVAGRTWLCGALLLRALRLSQCRPLLGARDGRDVRSRSRQGMRAWCDLKRGWRCV
jgi:hypothetical protein